MSTAVKTDQLHIRVDPDFKKALELSAADRKLSVSAYVESCLRSCMFYVR